MAGNLPPETMLAARELSTRLDRYLVGDHDHSKRPPGIHASEITHCHRRAAYTILDTEKQHNITLMMTKKFQIGHAVHAMIQRWWHGIATEEPGRYEFQDEVPINPDNNALAAIYQIYSSCDGVILDKQVGERIGLEIKTMAPKEFANLSNPKPEHIEQVHVYMACLNLRLMYLLYYDKGTEAMTPSREPFLVEFDAGLWRAITDRFDEWYELLATNKLPPQQPSFVCTFCPYEWTCRPPIYQSKQPMPTRRHSKR